MLQPDPRLILRYRLTSEVPVRAVLSPVSGDSIFVSNRTRCAGQDRAATDSHSRQLRYKAKQARQGRNFFVRSSSFVSFVQNNFVFFSFSFFTWGEGGRGGEVRPCVEYGGCLPWVRNGNSNKARGDLCCPSLSRSSCRSFDNPHFLVKICVSVSVPKRLA